jgi:hypothetical protein
MNVNISQTTTCIGGEMIINGKRVVNHGGGPMTVVSNSEGCARADTHADCLSGTFINGEKIMGASSGATSFVQQHNGSVVYHNGRRLDDDSDVIHVGKREKQPPTVSRLRLSATGKLLLNFEEIEGAIAFEVQNGKVRVFRDLLGEDIVVPDIKRIDVTGPNPFVGAPPAVNAVGDVSIICNSVSGGAPLATSCADTPTEGQMRARRSNRTSEAPVSAGRLLASHQGH